MRLAEMVHDTHRLVALAYFSAIRDATLNLIKGISESQEHDHAEA